MNVESLRRRLMLALQGVHMPAPLRVRLLRASGFDIDPTALVRSGVLFQVGSLHVGREAFIGNNCRFYASVMHPSRVWIGDETKVAPEVMFCCSTHHIGGGRRRAGKVYNRDITVGRGCWIGTRAILLPGVTVGDGAVIGAGAVVTKDVPTNCVGGGCPFRVIRWLDRPQDREVTGDE